MRNPILLLASGMQGIGKSYTSLKQMIYQAYVAKHRRKGLLFDTNNEYAEYEIDGKIHRIQKINHNEIIKYSNSQTPEVRRIVPFHANGAPMSPEETEKLLVQCLDQFRGGTLLIEDLNRIYGDALPLKLTGALVNVRHRNCDVVFHLQSIGRILPKMRQNTAIVRQHYQLDGIDDSSEKLGGEAEIFYIAEKMINKQHSEGNVRFFVYVYREIKKIKGAFSPKMFADACIEYMDEVPSTTSRIMNRRGADGKKMYNYGDAQKIKLNELYKKYYGN